MLSAFKNRHRNKNVRIYGSSLSMNGTSSKIINNTMPKPVEKIPSTYTKVVVPIAKSASTHNFVKKYDHNLKVAKTTQDKPTEIIREIVTKEIINNEIIRETPIESQLPSGTIMQFISEVAPSGWLLCDGSELSKSEYAALYKIIGDNYGSPSSDSMFKLPDFRGRVAIGAGQGNGLSNRHLGEIGGEETHKLTMSEMPAHNHNGTTSSNGNHTHNVNDPGHSHTLNGPSITGNNTVSNTFNKNDRTRLDNKTMGQVKTNIETSNISVGPNGDHTHTFTTNNAGGSQPHNIMQPYLATHYIIKV